MIRGITLLPPLLLPPIYLPVWVPAVEPKFGAFQFDKPPAPARPLVCAVCAGAGTGPVLNVVVDGAGTGPPLPLSAEYPGGGV